MCKVFIALFKDRISDIVAFCGMYRYGVWDIQQWIRKEWRIKDMNCVIKVGNRYIMGVMGISIWKYPVTTRELDYAYNFNGTLEAYAFIQDYGIKNWQVLDYAIERDVIGLKNGTKIKKGIGGSVRWE